jgi:PKD repeat protein
LTVNFTDTSANNPTSWSWTFGDGGTSTNQNPSHQYTSAGNYTVSLTVSNAASTDIESKVNYITVTNGVGALPEPWLDQDIGNTGAAGSATYAGSVFTIQGAGYDMWGSSDTFHYAYQPSSGDCTITARVVTQANTASIAKAGVNIRETLTSGSKSAYMVITPGDGAAFGWRSSNGGSTSDANGGNHPVPYWVRLVRSGDQFSAYASATGSTWTQVGSTQTISMASNAYIGLVVCSTTGSIGTATFDNVTCTP